MSQHPGQTPPGGREPTEEELRQYLGEMRQGHVGEIVAQVVSALLNGAQVKLGRRDARLLIDLAAGVSDQAGPHLDQQFTGEVNDVLTQLRTAQVEAEQELANLRAGGQAPPEPNDIGGGDTADDVAAEEAGAEDGEGTPPRPPTAPTPPPSSPASRLWTPGR